MVVDAGLAPVLGLVVEDFRFFVEGGVLGAKENAVGVGVARRLVVIDFAVVALESLAVVIPMNGHGESVGYEGSHVGLLEEIVHSLH